MTNVLVGIVSFLVGLAVGMMYNTYKLSRLNEQLNKREHEDDWP